MTGEEVRDVGYLKWKNEWAWMKTMKDKKWESLIKKERGYFLYWTFLILPLCLAKAYPTAIRALG